MNKKGFTLVELLVVIGILAILTAAVVIVLNPAELLRQSRDTQRMQDFDALRSSISLYMVAVSSPAIDEAGPYYTEGTADFCTLGVGTANTSTAIDSTGWIRINFSGMSNPSSPISALPLDPVNDATYKYAFIANTTLLTYELDANLESSKYASTKEAGDGGNTATCYEIGNDPGLDL